MTNKAIENAIEIVTSFFDTRFPVDVDIICKELGIRIFDSRALDKDGYLICQSGKKIIMINSQIINRHRKKFIIAHELGHFLLHREQLYSCGHISETQGLEVNNQNQESEANAFATELLIPFYELRNIMPNRTIQFSDVFQVASLFDVSITHAAMQAILASNSESEVLICYEHQKRKWYLSANKYTYNRMIPFQCPVDLSAVNGPRDIIGAWTELYCGAVHQEVFSPYSGQYLVLLSGNRK